MITGAARNTKFRANELSIYTSGALAPQLGDGLMLTTHRIVSGERLPKMWCCESRALQFHFADGGRFRQLTPQDWAEYRTRESERQFLKSCRILCTTFVVCSTGERRGAAPGQSFRVPLSLGIAISLESPGLSVLTCARSQ